jgi:hypothetical protein
MHYNGIEKLHIKIEHNTYMTNKKNRYTNTYTYNIYITTGEVKY